MAPLLEQPVCLLQRILQARLSGVIRYTHYSLMVSGRDRFTFSSFFIEQSNHSLRQAQEAGQILMALNERPAPASQVLPEPSQQSIQEMLLRSLHHERQLLQLHQSLLQSVKIRRVFSLEEFAMGQLLACEVNCHRLSQLLSEMASVCVHAGSEAGVSHWNSRNETPPQKPQCR